MGRRKNNQTSTSLNNTQHQATKVCFDDDEEEENINLDDSIVATEKAIAMDDVTMSDPNAPFVDGGDDDKTSADYYFDSYSHFGNTTLHDSLYFIYLNLLLFFFSFGNSLLGSVDLNRSFRLLMNGTLA